MSGKILFIVVNVLKGFVYRLFHDCQLDINRDVSAAYYRSLSGDCVDLLSRIICKTVVANNSFISKPTNKARIVIYQSLTIATI